MRIKLITGPKAGIYVEGHPLLGNAVFEAEDEFGRHLIDIGKAVKTDEAVTWIAPEVDNVPLAKA